MPALVAFVHRWAGAGLLLWLLATACGGAGGAGDDAGSPAVTFRTLRQALQAGDAAAAWSCLAPGYRRELHADDAAAFAAYLDSPEGRRWVQQVLALEISAEVEINARAGFLQFDETTVAPNQAPFFYFLREPDGWRLTTHLDSRFRQELESAIAAGELVLPPGRASASSR